MGWSDPEGSRPYVGALLLGYYESDGRLVYAGRVGTGMSQKTLATLHKRLQPLAIRKMRLAAPPPRDNRFLRPLELAKVHWLRPELVAEITYLTWPDDGLLRHTVFVGLREDKPAREVRRETPQGRNRHREGVAVFAIDEEGVARDALVHEADLLVERDGGRVVRPNLEFDPGKPLPERVVDCGLEEPEADAAPAALRDDAHTDRAPVGEGGSYSSLTRQGGGRR